jgi:hypothetical protein
MLGGTAGWGAGAGAAELHRELPPLAPPLYGSGMSCVAGCGKRGGSGGGKIRVGVVVRVEASHPADLLRPRGGMRGRGTALLLQTPIGRAAICALPCHPGGESQAPPAAPPHARPATIHPPMEDRARDHQTDLTTLGAAHG